MILTYDHLYRLSEELQQLKGAQLQGAAVLAEGRYAMDFRLPGQSRWLVVDLAPARPFIVSIPSTRLKGPKKPTPVLNFLKAHFVNLRLHSLEIAQKPNRTIKMIFVSPSKQAEMVFKCFPHGQHLLLTCEGKTVNQPLRPKPGEEEEPVSYVEPEISSQWNLNDETARDFLKMEGPTAGKSDEAIPYHQKLIRKLEKALAGLDKDADQRKAENQARIDGLQKEAEELKSQKEVDGPRLQSVYDEIKKLKRKILLTATRRNELEAQLHHLKTEPPPAGEKKEISKSLNPSKKGESLFSGTRVRLEDPWELWVGRSDWQNDDLVRLAGPHELWIHLRDYPGAHGVIRGPKKGGPPPLQIEFACRVVAQLSQSKKNPFADGEKLDFIVTPKKFVKKPKGAPPGRVIVERESIRRIAFKSVKFEVI